MKTLISAVLISAACAVTARAGAFDSLSSEGARQDIQFQEPKAAPAGYGGGGGQQLSLSQEGTASVTIDCSRPDMGSVNYAMRSPDGAVGSVSPALVKLLCRISAHFRGAEIQVVRGGGYRSAADNTLNSGMASGSQHLYGKAADIRIYGYSVSEVGAAARSLGAGGVGYYPNYPEVFTHVDVGGRRTWTGGAK